MLAMTLAYLNKKSRHSAVIFCSLTETLGGRFAERLDALGAEHFVYRAALLHHNRLLQVGLEGSIGRALREGAVVSEGCGFATVCAFCHEIIFLSCYNSDSKCLFATARHL